MKHGSGRGTGNASFFPEAARYLVALPTARRQVEVTPSGVSEG